MGVTYSPDTTSIVTSLKSMILNDTIGDAALSPAEKRNLTLACDIGGLVILILGILALVFPGSTTVIAQRLLLIGAGYGILLLFSALSGVSLGGKRIYYGLLVICILGLAARIFFLYTPGTDDLGCHEVWAIEASTKGLVTFYQEAFKKTGPDSLVHPPLTVFALSTMGYAYRWFISDNFTEERQTFRKMLRFPAIFADLMTVVLLFFIMRQYRGNRAGMIAALVYALHPAIIYDSTIWGQTDAIYTLLLLAMLYAWMARRWFVVGTMFALSILAKPQSMVLSPLLILLCVSRPHVIWKVIVGGLVSAGVFIIVFMHGNIQAFAPAYTRAIGGMPELTRSAYNLWWALFGNAAPTTSSTGTLLGLTYRTIGLLLYGFTVAMILWRLWRIFRKSFSRETEVPALLVGSGLLVYAFFLFNVEMHERYMFSFITLGLPLLFIHWRTALLYICASAGFFFNLTAVYHHFTTVDITLTHIFPNMSNIIAGVNIFIFLFLLRQLWSWGNSDLAATQTFHPLMATQ